MRNLKRRRNIVTVVAFFAALFCCASARANDIQINPTGPVFRVNNQTLAWGITGGGGIQNNFFFSPLSPSEYVCTYVYNNNPTNQHGILVTINITANVLSTGPSDGTWNFMTGGGGANQAQPFPSPALIIGSYVSGAGLVSVNISGTSTQAGSPDTANLFIVQTQQPCAAVRGNSSSQSTTVSALPAILNISDSTGLAFSANATMTNPAGSLAAATIFQTNTGSSAAIQAYLDSVTISCTATCTVQLNNTATAGTCSAVASIPSMNVLLGTGSNMVFSQACTVQPALNATPYKVWVIAANTPTILDLKGFVIGARSLNGFAFTPANFTGTINVSLQWWEK